MYSDYSTIDEVLVALENCIKKATVFKLSELDNLKEGAKNERT
jgi:hypothetical protein